MNSPELYIGEGFLWRLEARLAHLIGRDGWPAIEARTTSRHVPANLRTYDAFTSFLPFVWTVNGEPYATTLRASFIRPESLLQEQSATILQYNPARPSRVYYAAQMMLARLFLALLTVSLMVAAVVVALVWIVRR